VGASGAEIAGNIAAKCGCVRWLRLGRSLGAGKFGILRANTLQTGPGREWGTISAASSSHVFHRLNRTLRMTSPECLIHLVSPLGKPSPQICFAGAFINAVSRIAGAEGAQA
jgi:hypothetical protein